MTKLRCTGAWSASNLIATLNYINIGLLLQMVDDPLSDERNSNGRFPAVCWSQRTWSVSSNISVGLSKWSLDEHELHCSKKPAWWWSSTCSWVIALFCNGDKETIYRANRAGVGWNLEKLCSGKWRTYTMNGPHKLPVLKEEETPDPKSDRSWGNEMSHIVRFV